MIKFEYQAQCLLKTQPLNKLYSFSDFTINEMNDYAGCIYDLANEFNIEIRNFNLNRLNKKFSYILYPDFDTVTENYYNMPYETKRFFIFEGFVQYLFGIDGERFYSMFNPFSKNDLASASYEETYQYNNLARKFFQVIFYDLWGLFNKHKIVKQKVLDYFCDIGILNKHEHGYARNPKCDYGIGYKI